MDRHRKYHLRHKNGYFLTCWRTKTAALMLKYAAHLTADDRHKDSVIQCSEAGADTRSFRHIFRGTASRDFDPKRTREMLITPANGAKLSDAITLSSATNTSIVMQYKKLRYR